MKYFYIPYIVFAITLITQLIIFSPKVAKNTQNNVNLKNTINESFTKEEKKNAEREDYLYKIKSKNNKVYLFDNSNNIIDILEIEYNNLREYDKKQIDLGINVNSKEDIYYFIEDFSN